MKMKTTGVKRVCRSLKSHKNYYRLASVILIYLFYYFSLPFETFDDTIDQIFGSTNYDIVNFTWHLQFSVIIYPHSLLI